MNNAKRSIYSLGRIFTWVIAILLLLVTIAIAFDPVGMVVSQEAESIGFLVKQPIMNIIWRVLFAIIGLLNIGLMNAATEYVRNEDDASEGILRWAHYIGIASAIIAVLNWVHFVNVNDLLIQLVKDKWSIEEIARLRILPVDSYFIWTFGGWGLYHFVINSLGLKRDRMPKGMGIIGIITSINLFLLVITYILGIEIPVGGGYNLHAVMIFAGLCGGIFGPIWHIWFARCLKNAVNYNEIYE